MTREVIISDAEIARVHGRANFGTMTAREVVDDGISNVAVGHHCGHTQFTILREHGLITKPKAMSYDCNLTKKGKKYYRAVLAARTPAPEGEVVAWQRLHPESGWLPVDESHVAHYREKGQAVRPLYASPVVPVGREEMQKRVFNIVEPLVLGLATEFTYAERRAFANKKTDDILAALGTKETDHD
jgi:hypothetical protein